MHQTSSKVLSLELLRSLLRTTGNKNLNFGQSLIHRAINKLRFKPNSTYLSHSSTPCWILHVSRFFGPHLSYFLRGSARTILVLSLGTVIFRVSSQLRLPTPTLLPSQMSCNMLSRVCLKSSSHVQNLFRWERKICLLFHLHQLEKSRCVSCPMRSHCLLRNLGEM